MLPIFFDSKILLLKNDASHLMRKTASKNSSRTFVRLGAWFWSAKADTDIFFSESLHFTRTTKLYNRIIQQNVRTKSYQRLLRVKPCNHNPFQFNSYQDRLGRTVWKKQAAANSLFFLCSFLANKSVNNIVTQRWTGAVSVIHVSTTWKYNKIN